MKIRRSETDVRPRSTRRWRAFALVLLGSVLASAFTGMSLGCTPSMPEITRLRAVSDGPGGAIIVWERKSGGISGGRVSGDGSVGWVQEGLAGTPDTARILDLVSDDQGGILFTWFDRSSLANAHSVLPVFVQRVSASGEALWGDGVQAGTAEAIALDNPELRSTPQIAPDNKGGAYLARTDSAGLHLQALDAQGRLSWQKVIDPGTLLADGGVKLASDGAAGLIVLAREILRDAGTPEFDVRAQRFDVSGAPLWQERGTRLYSDWPWIPPFQVDEQGGIFLVDAHIQQVFSSNYSGQNPDPHFVAAQWLSGHGELEWPIPGMKTTETSAMLSSPLPLVNGTQAATVLWTESSSGGPYTAHSLRAVRISNAGNVIWRNDAVSSPRENRILGEIKGCEAGDGIFLAWRAGTWDWEKGGTIEAQTLNGDGATELGDAFPIFPSALKYQSGPCIVEDAAGGAIIIGIVGESSGRGDMVYGQRLDASGTPLWGEAGVRLDKQGRS